MGFLAGVRTQVTCQKIKSQTRQQISSPHSLTTSHRPDQPWPPPALPTRQQRKTKTEEPPAWGWRVCRRHGVKPGRAERCPHHGARKQNSAGRQRSCACPLPPQERQPPCPLPGHLALRCPPWAPVLRRQRPRVSGRALPQVPSFAVLITGLLPLLPSVRLSQGRKSGRRSPPLTPFSLPTMPWEPEKCSRASSSFFVCVFVVVFLNNSYNNNNNSNNKNNRPSPRQFQVSPK